MGRGRFFVGTSGFAYKEWKPEFYPTDLKSKDMLAYYSERFPSVEINNTFYRMPSEKTLAGWVEQTPERFVFTLKGSQRITHFARLGDVDEPLDYFLRTAHTLGARLGAILWQCPPTLRYDADLLNRFLVRLPGDFRFAMEFRHESWSAPEAREALAANNVAWCVADTEAAPAAMLTTSETFAYVRLRKDVYEDGELTRWGAAIAETVERGLDVYCYTKHEDDPSGIRHARRLRELVEPGTAGGSGATDPASTDPVSTDPV